MLQPPGPRHQVQPVTHQPTVAPDPRGVGHQPAALPLPAVGALRDQRCARGRQCPQFEASISAEHLDLGPCVLAQRVTSTPALHGASRECFRLQTIQALRIAKTCNLRHQIHAEWRRFPVPESTRTACSSKSRRVIAQRTALCVT
ncbi:hypothetical protein G6F31_019535 [Rhizopus arrhizus]|nr:hypothetical protein G6F31_019535 [Rhizopus arrhizus]